LGDYFKVFVVVNRNFQGVCTAKKSRTYGERLPWTDAEKVFDLAEMKRIAVTDQSLSNWRRTGVPSHAIVKILRARGTVTGTPPSEVTARPEHLRREFQRTHSFSLIVQAMWDLEQRSDDGDKEAARRLRAIWDLMHGVREVVSQVAGWTDEDWKRLIGVDYWRRITRKAESSIDEVLTELLRSER
jgi:hypothetical protein